ncbi:hypothetical protein PC115_g24426 [Phytophthora cactorum]|uniref:Reverse transcriptase Ty1/copia-type domain-containing protein n=1 Tax=Phytophthora cactorum TaxID=29920 RepID=A0A8T1A5M4_9STRA|nr:hypothetical protein PC115_g24426 [Phytophthora cactorum]
MVIAIAKYFGWPLDQLDVVTAFLLLRVTGLVSVIDREPVSPNRSNPNPRRLRHRGLRHCRLRHLWVQDCSGLRSGLTQRAHSSASSKLRFSNYTFHQKRLKWDPKARTGLFLGYEEVSKAYRLYDIEAGQVVISRDVNFDESTFGLSPRISDEDVDDLDVDSLDIDDDGPRQTEYTQTGKRKSSPNDEDEATRRPHTVRHRPGLEEASAPDSSSSSHRVDADEEEKSGDQDEESTPPVFWRASANAVEATVDLSEPSTFQEAVNGPDQVHWRKAIHAELKSMRLRGVFRAAKLPNGQRAIGTKWVLKIKRKADGSIEKYKARLVAKGFKQNT